MSKECTTHHHACDCREEKFKELERENKQLRQTVLETLNQRGQRELIVAWDRAKELERENAALRERLDSVQKSHFTLSKDNAALRTLLKRWLKVADDCHLEQQEVGYSEYNITVGLVCNTRALLDAARKEAQP